MWPNLTHYKKEKRKKVDIFSRNHHIPSANIHNFLTQLNNYLSQFFVNKQRKETHMQLKFPSSIYLSFQFPHQSKAKKLYYSKIPWINKTKPSNKETELFEVAETFIDIKNRVKGFEKRKQRWLPILIHNFYTYLSHSHKKKKKKKTAASKPINKIWKYWKTKTKCETF